MKKYTSDMLKEALKTTEKLDFKADSLHLGAIVNGQIIAAYIVADALNQLSDTISQIRFDHPLQGETFDGIRDGLFAISEALQEQK